MRKLIVLSLYAYAVLLAADKKPQQHGSVKFVANPPEDKPLGYFTILDAKRVHITSLNGTIDVVMPRLWKGRWQAMSKAEQDKEIEEDNKRVWPIGSDEYTSDFLNWMGRVQWASDAGVLPPK